MEDNSHAGQGAVVLDIGGDVGALVVLMPAGLAGVEIEARPVGAVPPAPAGGPGSGPGSGPDSGHDHDHGPDSGRDHGHVHLEHVAVLARPTPDGRQLHSAVFPALRAGTYELYERPAGPVRLSVEVRGGVVADAVWP